MQKFLQINDLIDVVQKTPAGETDVVSGPALPEHYRGLVLRVADDGLSLLSTLTPTATPTRVDFGSRKLAYRLNTTRRNEGLPKAIGLDKMTAPEVVDATAGLGTDAFVLASLGATVLLLEKSPVMAALLRDGLERGKSAGDPTLKSVLQRMQLSAIDAHQHFDAMAASQQPDVVYLDPMFPPRRKSASVKKDMALMQSLLPANDDVEQLLTEAMGCARKRVVVKRPGKAAKTVSPKPDFQVPGKACHFQVYLTGG